VHLDQTGGALERLAVIAPPDQRQAGWAHQTHLGERKAVIEVGTIEGDP
jgi:hypothetical protein